MGLKTLNRNQTGEKGRGGSGLGFCIRERLKREQCESLLQKQLPDLEPRSHWARLIPSDVTVSLAKRFWAKQARHKSDVWRKAAGWQSWIVGQRSRNNATENMVCDRHTV